ncbi:MAG: HEAT repeat protein [Hyphomicrobiaceae bacterium]
MTEAEFLDALKSTDAVRCEAVLLAFQEGTVQASEASIDAFVHLLAAPTKSVRRRAAGALAKSLAAGLGEAPLAAALSNRNPLRRWGAVFASAEAGRTDESTYSGALDALASEDGDVRWAAAEIVRRLSLTHDPNGRALARLASSESSHARKMALYCMRDLGCSEAEVLSTALADEVAFVRLAALAAVSHFQRAGGPMLRLIEGLLMADPDPGVQRAAATVLGTLGGGDSAAIAALEAASEDSDTSLAKAATGALARVRAEAETPDKL